MSKKPVGFVPLIVPTAPETKEGSAKTTATVNLKGVAAEEFLALSEQYGLNRSQLLLQMVYHCLNRTEDLKDLYRRIAILGK